MAANYRHSRRRCYSTQVQEVWSDSLDVRACSEPMTETTSELSFRTEKAAEPTSIRALAPELGDELDVSIEVDNVTGSGLSMD